MCCSWGTLAVNTPASPGSHWGKLKAEQTIAEICIYIYICARRDFARKQGRKEALTIDHLQSWWAFPSVAAAAPAPILVSSRLVSGLDSAPRPLIEPAEGLVGCGGQPLRGPRESWGDRRWEQRALCLALWRAQNVRDLFVGPQEVSPQ
jgi:hypothetical protein